MSMTETMWRHVAAWPGWPSGAGLNAFGEGARPALVRPLPGGGQAGQYVHGGALVHWPFAVTLRCGGTQTRERLDACALLEALGLWLGRELPELGAGRAALWLRPTGLPALAAAYPDGGEDYEAVFALAYAQAPQEGEGDG